MITKEERTLLKCIDLLKSVDTIVEDLSPSIEVDVLHIYKDHEGFYRENIPVNLIGDMKRLLHRCVRELEYRRSSNDPARKSRQRLAFI